VSTPDDYFRYIYINPNLSDSSDYRAHMIKVQVRNQALKPHELHSARNEDRDFQHSGTALPLAPSAHRPDDCNLPSAAQPGSNALSEKYIRQQVQLSDARLRLMHKCGTELKEDMRKVREARKAGHSEVQPTLTVERALSNCNLQYGLFVQSVQEELIKKEPATVAAAAAATVRKLPADARVSPAWQQMDQTAADEHAMAVAMPD